MKYTILFLLFVFIACKSAQTDIPSLEECPNEGDCQVQLFKETKLFLEEDEANIVEISFEDDLDFQVVLIQYKDKKRVGYSEEIYLQIPSRFKEIKSKNHSLQNQKLTFNKFCKCEDQGLEKIYKGELKLTKHKDKTSLHLEFYSTKQQFLQILDINI